jgi:hypothetical protein
VQSAKISRAAFTDDQIRLRNRVVLCREIVVDDRFRVIEIEGEGCRQVRVDAAHIRAEIGEQTSANCGRQSAADLNDAEALQQFRRCSSLDDAAQLGRGAHRTIA